MGQYKSEFTDRVSVSITVLKACYSQTNSLTELWQLNKSANSYSPVPSEII